jgi:hypothetical protein
MEWGKLNGRHRQFFIREDPCRPWSLAPSVANNIVSRYRIKLTERVDLDRGWLSQRAGQIVECRDAPVDHCVVHSVRDAKVSVASAEDVSRDHE